MTVGCEPGYLGVAHRAFTPDGPGLSNLGLAGGMTADRQHDRRSLLAQFDTVRREIDASGTMAGLDSFAQRAFDMVASGATRRALDLSHEDPRSRDRYRGIEQFLTARRLIEAGVGCVTLGLRRLGHALAELHHAAPPASRIRSRHRQPHPGPARSRHGR